MGNNPICTPQSRKHTESAVKAYSVKDRAWGARRQNRQHRACAVSIQRAESTRVSPSRNWFSTRIKELVKRLRKVQTHIWATVSILPVTVPLLLTGNLQFIHSFEWIMPRIHDLLPITLLMGLTVSKGVWVILGYNQKRHGMQSFGQSWLPWALLLCDR